MSRNISLAERVVILILVMGAVLGAGFYFFILPAHKEVGLADSRIEEKEKQIKQAEGLRNESFRLDDEYKKKRERTETAHIGFYNEMTFTEAVTLTQKILKDAGGFEPAAGISIDAREIEAEVFRVLLNSNERDIKYRLREFAFLFSALIDEYNNSENEENEEDEELSFSEELKEYFFGKDYDSDDPEFLTKMLNIYFQMLSFDLNYPLSHELVSAIKDTASPNKLSAETIKALADWFRIRLAFEDAEIGRITTKFTLLVTYPEYVQFLKYIQKLPERTAVTTCTLWEDERIGGDEGEQEFEISLHFYIMKPMEIPPSEPNPFSSNTDDSAGEEQESAEEESETEE
ncbi:MAG: hypothetical protein FWG44_02365 [Oscillospiraceae bacterium]|nr:hypothetical protein [Oscillospiraceae bacterium]